MPTPSAVEHLLASPGVRADAGVRSARLQLTEHWLATASERPLLAIVAHTGGRPRLLLTDRVAEAEALLARPGADLDRLSALLDAPWVDPDRPLRLERLAVAKPWGRELWYTGIEARGVCAAHPDGAPGPTLPLPWLLAALPDRYGGVRAPVLLKVLDPHPEPGRGDLYFELHEHKQELFLVTTVDPGAWPQGIGRVRLGFDPGRIAALGDAGLRAAFLAAVRRYESVRRRLDAHLDAARDALGLERNAILPAAEARHLEEQLPADLVARERSLRAEVEGFTHLQPVVPGDLIRIPPGLPHALQHGVRVVEFQTPSYERRILWFGQKVLTQSHWDTEAAVARMTLRPPRSPGADTGNRTMPDTECLDRFDDVRILRIRLPAGTRHPLPPAAHAVLIALSGRVVLDGVEVGPEQALLVPGPALARPLVAGSEDALCAIALHGETP